MLSDPKTGNDPESKFSFGVREIRAANVAQKLSANVAQKLSAVVAPLKEVNEDRGVDPYNTSGSFDRTRNWMRVGKR
jgi:hypothetical protein